MQCKLGLVLIKIEAFTGLADLRQTISINRQSTNHSRQLCPQSGLQHLKKTVIGSSADRI